MLVIIKRNWNPCALLAQTKSCTTSVGTNAKALQKTKMTIDNNSALFTFKRLSFYKGY